MKIPFPFLALLCLSVTIGAEANLATSQARQRTRGLLRVSMSTDGVARQQTAAQPWWHGFQDETLDALIATAQQHASHSGSHGGSTGRPTADVRLMGETLQLPLTWIKLPYRLGGSGTLAAPFQPGASPDAATGVPPPMHGQAGRSRSPLV
ncbi:MAG: hypothetical protein V4636_11050 [Pseudomonadota bacterium]